MKVKILYEDNINNGYKNYTTIEIPNGDYETLIEIDYQQRLEEAPDAKKNEVKKCESVQEVFDLLNKREYNNWHKFERHRDSKLKYAYEEDDDVVDGMDCFADETSTKAFDKVLDYDDACTWVRNRLSKEQADVFIAVVLDEVTPEEYADAHDLKRDTVYKRLQRAKEKLKKYFL